MSTPDSHPGGEIQAHLQVLADPLRTRILVALIEADPGLSVSELTKVLAAPQSTVSRHVKVLLERRWIERRQSLLSAAAVAPPLASLWAVVRGQLEAEGVFEEDRRRLRAVLALRSEAPYFQRVAGHWEEVRRELYGTAWVQHVLTAMLRPDLVVADLGCGQGELLPVLAAACGRVVGVDGEEAMLQLARHHTEGLDNVELHRADLGKLPLEDASLDVALTTLVLGVVDDHGPVVAELARCLKPGGTWVIADLQPHDDVELQAAMGHHHLGLPEEHLEVMASQVGLVVERYTPLPVEAGAVGPALFVARVVRGL